jgi:hypothetical protein
MLNNSLEFINCTKLGKNSHVNNFTKNCIKNSCQEGWIGKKYHSNFNIDNLDYFYDVNIQKHCDSLDYFVDPWCVKEQVCDLASLPSAVGQGNILCKICKNECVSHMDYFYVPDCTNITNLTKCNQFSVDNFDSKSDFKDGESIHKLDCISFQISTVTLAVVSRCPAIK